MTQKKSVKIGIYTIDICIEKNNMYVSIWDTTNLTFPGNMPQYIGGNNFNLKK